MSLVLALFLWLGTDTLQVDADKHELLVLTDSLTVDNLGVFFSSHESWRFSPGDDLQWADPHFDDSDWHHIMPGGMTEPLPDSLWPGYGWFRIRLLADESFYHHPWFFYLFTWGAAEVYIDGEFYRSFGTFSTDPALERRHNPVNYTFKASVLAPRDTHTVAVRLSYHPAHRYKRIMGDASANFGFGIGFVTDQWNENAITSLRISQRVAYFSMGILLLITLLNGFLYYMFPQQRSSLLVAIFTFLLLLHTVCAFHHLFFETARLWNFILQNYSFLLLFLSAIFLIPYTIIEIFSLKKLKWTRFLPLSVIPLMIVATFNIMQLFLGIIIVSGLAVMVTSGLALRHAYVEKRDGVGFVAFGFIGLLLLTFVLIIYGEIGGQSSLASWAIEAVGITIVYTIVPISMTLFTAYRMARLYSGLEKMVDERTAALQQSIEDLEAAQTQLVQQEKLASLGQLTAGIAHEIKNPLNFVNNFSSVSQELIDEAFEELDKLEKNDTTDEVRAILDDIKANLGKIHEHGSRADRIVKSMLLHSRGGSGKMEPTDLNAVVREYANLAFHGMRAGKEPFDVSVDLSLDEHVGQVKLVSEDFSRVLLNLCNNAFDAMRDKLKASEKGAYRAKLTVSTKRDAKHVYVSVADNGPGVSDEFKDKILQPFFTTKKGTAGTGLGLSITHDIIKAHGGTLQIEDAEDGGAVFRITLPG